MAVRKQWIGGNWKCNGLKAGIDKLADTFNKMEIDDKKVEVHIFPSPIQMTYTRSKMDAKIHVGAQNVSATSQGAFTGEMDCSMIQDFGMDMTLVGHSERRSIYGETDEIVAQKVKKCQEAKMQACICIGETLEERESNKTAEVNARQLKACFPVITEWKDIVIAYEPVWAIGTGKTATPEMAEATHKEIRDLIRSEVSAEVADSVRIVYGGSMNDKNCAELLACENIDGGLVGGASLKDAFCTIVAASNAN